MVSLHAEMEEQDRYLAGSPVALAVVRWPTAVAGGTPHIPAAVLPGSLRLNHAKACFTSCCKSRSRLCISMQAS